MYKYIVLCLCLSLSGVICDLNKEEGAECEWEGLKGKCVKETRCLTTLDEGSPKHPICSRKGGKPIICCTDCELVNNTENAVFSPTSGLYWKDGRKARDSCLQYLEELPYPCKQDGFYGGISRALDEENNCYMHYEWAVEGEPANGTKHTAKYPHRVLLGFGDDAETAKWTAGGFIVSDTYIVTTARVFYIIKAKGEAMFLAMGVINLFDSPSSWQIRKVKRFIPHPEFKNQEVLYNDIALIETDIPITFDKNVLPACLHVEEDAFVEDAVATTWVNYQSNHLGRTDTVHMIKVKQFSEQECKAAYGPKEWLEHGYDHKTQMCYGSKSNKTHQYCTGWTGEPLMITTQFSSCVHTAIGTTSLGGGRNCLSRTYTPDLYTRIAPYVPWIESIVWP